MIYSNISQFTVKDTKERYPFTAEHAQSAADIVACAGLLHDIGNPPFGHFGEDVVHSWFDNNFSKLSYQDEDTKKDVFLTKKEIIFDLKHFEGNAQAFRLLTKLHSGDSEHGLNLTTGVLSTIVKYPTDSSHIDSKSPNVCLHKLGYYYTDQDFFKTVSESTGTYFDNIHHRHPLTFILEAADDIAYATADLEDSYKKKLFTVDEFKDFFFKELDSIKDKKQRDYSNKLIEQLEKYRVLGVGGKLQ